MVEVVFRSEEDRQQFLKNGVIPGYLENRISFSGMCEFCPELGYRRCRGHICDDADVLCDLRDALLVVRREYGDEIPIGIIIESSLC